MLDTGVHVAGVVVGLVVMGVDVGSSVTGARVVGSSVTGARVVGPSVTGARMPAEQPAVFFTSVTTVSLHAPPISCADTQKKAPPLHEY